jgi:hypothetical protein
MLDQRVGGKPSHPTEQLLEPPSPDELEVMLEEQLSDRLRVPSDGGVLDRVLD